MPKAGEKQRGVLRLIVRRSDEGDVLECGHTVRAWDDWKKVLKAYPNSRRCVECAAEAERATIGEGWRAEDAGGRVVLVRRDE